MALILILSLIVATSVTVLADGDVGYHGIKWAQLPDESNGAIAVMCIEGDIELADDFLCTETGLITDIHVWGSWFADGYPKDPPVFWIGIYSDIPEVPDVSHSMPDDLLEEYIFGPGEYTVGPPTSYNGKYYHPMGGSVDTTQMHQYNFYIPIEDAFPQEQGTIYWLSVLEIDAYQDDFWWGWNIAQYGERWNDDAVYWYDEKWYELEYPYGHPYADQSMDLAFVITGPTSEPPPSQPPPGDTVGGDVYPANKTSLLIPWVALGIAILAGGVYLIRRRVHR